MFYYWDGFEIDGSDTDFDLVLPENQERVDFVKCFLSMPVISRWSPIGVIDSKKKISVQQLYQEIEKGTRRPFEIYINCGIMEEFLPELQARIYSYSKGRDPLEDVYGKVVDPCMSPHIPDSLDRGGSTLVLYIYPPGTKKKFYIGKDVELDGYIRNPDIFFSTDELGCFSLSCGPGFYYEYVMYIMDYLQEHFPGIGITGGLDCGGGWTGGCTYASSIYNFERVVLPVNYSVRNTLKYLTQFDLLRSYECYYKKGFVYNYINDFSLVNKLAQTKDKKNNTLSFGEYADWVESQILHEEDPLCLIFATAIAVMLPRKDIFQRSRIAMEKLSAALDGVKDPGNDSYYTGYFAFSRKEGKTVCEYRVYPEMKPYLLALLELAEQGVLDFQTEVVYRRRHP